MVNKNWNSHVWDCWTVWHARHHKKGLGFLEDLPTYHAYLALLSSVSEEQLEWRHANLPPCARLLPDDLAKLLLFWKHYFTGQEAEECRDQLEQWLLMEQSISWHDAPEISLADASTDEILERAACHSSGAGEYYVRRIKEKGTGQPPEHFPDNGHAIMSRILSCPGRSGYGDSHFTCRLFGEEITTAFFRAKSGDYLLARLLFKEMELTEKTVRRVISELPPYYIWKYGVTLFSSGEGLYLNLAFEFSTNRLAGHLEVLGDDRVAVSEFPELIAGVLREKGIPVQSVIPIEAPARAK